MSKVFAQTEARLFYINKEHRGKVVQVDMSRPGYPETLLSFPINDIFQVVYDDQGRLLALGEESAQVVWYDLRIRAVSRTLQLETSTII